MDRKIRKNKKSYTLYDMYNNYCREFGLEVPYVTFKSILEAFNENIKETIMERSESFKMPFGLGYICIIKYKPKQYNARSLSIDYTGLRYPGLFLTDIDINFSWYVETKENLLN